MAEYESLEQFVRIYRGMTGPGGLLWLGMFVISTDYEYSDKDIGYQLIADSIGYASLADEDAYGRALVSGNAFDDIEKNEELGARMLIDATERGCDASLFPAGLCLIAGIGVERDPARVDEVMKKLINEINLIDDLQERQKSAKIINTFYSNLVETEKAYQINPVAIREQIDKYFKNEGVRIHDFYLTNFGSAQRFDPKIAAEYHFDDFGPYEPDDYFAE